MATLRLMRPDERNNHLAELIIYLNGERLASLNNNDTKDFELPAGQHLLKASIDSLGSKEYRFSLSHEENKALVIATDNKANNPEPLVSGTWLDFIVVPLQLLYYFVMGQNRHVTISHVNME